MKAIYFQEPWSSTGVLDSRRLGRVVEIYLNASVDGRRGRGLWSVQMEAISPVLKGHLVHD